MVLVTVVCGVDLKISFGNIKEVTNICTFMTNLMSGTQWKSTLQP